jgi:hypothetical protein
MGLVGTGIFQARRDGRWEDVVSEIDACDAPVIYWLEKQPERGFPPDFEVEGEGRHPISDGNLRPPRYRGERYLKGHPLHGVIHLGEHVQSWLTGDEMLAAVDADLVGWRSEEGVIPGWGNFREFFGEVRRLKALHGEVRLVFGLTY